MFPRERRIMNSLHKDVQEDRKQNQRKHPSTVAQGSSSPWSVILAGGEGERIRPFVYRWLKRYKPKQYCAFVGTRSMLQHTLARADLISSRERQITVIRQTHLDDARPQFVDRSFGNVIVQPDNRDTGAGIFLPLTYIRAHDPGASFVIHPSDHFVYPEKSFGDVLNGMAQAAEDFPGRMVLLGAFPDYPETDYGWIIPGEDFSWARGRRIRTVRSFLEKPTAEQARDALASNGVWNTLILASKVETLWEMGWRCFPDMMILFERLGDAIGTSNENKTLNDIYRVMPVHNFSKGLLRCVVGRILLMQMEGTLWSDWGRPERIGETLRRMEKSPAFPWACLSPSGGPMESIH